MNQANLFAVIHSRERNEAHANAELAISGASADNIAEMLPYVGDFLIATSISKDFYNLDEDKCLALVNAARSAEEHFLKSVAN